MFGLSGQIQRHKCGIGGGIGQDQNIRWAGKHVDAHGAKELALGFGDIGVAGSGQNIGGRCAELAKSHRRDALNAAQTQDRIRSGKVHGIERRRIDPLR